MSDETSLITTERPRFVVNITPDAVVLRERVLAGSALIARVSNPEEQAAAVAAQAEIDKLRRTAERERKELKKPILEAGRELDRAVDRFVIDLTEESGRMAKLLGDYEMLLRAKQRAAEQAQREELARIERERQAALAAAKSHDDLDRVNAEYNQQIRETPPPPAPQRAPGQVMRDDWDITVTNPFLLVQRHPECVRIEPKLGEIKMLLDRGVDVAGITAKRIVKSATRTSGKAELIEA